MIAQHGEMLAKALSTQTDLRVVVVNCPSLASHGVWQGWSLKLTTSRQEKCRNGSLDSITSQKAQFKVLSASVLGPRFYRWAALLLY
jgi:hypothetical protein